MFSDCKAALKEPPKAFFLIRYVGVVLDGVKRPMHISLIMSTALSQGYLAFLTLHLVVGSAWALHLEKRRRSRRGGFGFLAGRDGLRDQPDQQIRAFPTQPRSLRSRPGGAPVAIRKAAVSMGLARATCEADANFFPAPGSRC